MSPARTHVEQSRNTLLFASCAKEVTTNAQVNVVVSDKALVKHLQRELGRLENELRISGTNSLTSDSAALLKEKDLQIEELKKEIAKLTLQRDLAQSQTGSDNHYPKLRVRESWNEEVPTFDISALSDSHSLDVGSFETSQKSDRDSRSNSEEHYLQFDCEENFLNNDTSPSLSTSSGYGGTNPSKGWDEIDGPTDEIFDDLCKEVRCIEIEESSTNRHVESNTLFPDENPEISALKVVGNGDKGDQELVPCPLKDDRELHRNHPVYDFPSPEEPSSWLLAKDTSSSRCLKLSKSRSCKASLMSSLSSGRFEKTEKNEHTPPNMFEKDFSGRPEGLQIKFSALNYGPDNEKFTTEDSQNLVGSAVVDELKAQIVNTSNDEDNTSINTIKEMAKLQFHEQLADTPPQETESEAKEFLKNVKDVGLDPLQDESESPPNWPLKFKRLQREIIDLWDACNMSLVHRTYFFLLFKGDLTDGIYMEVELRRLSFLKDTFSRGNQTVEDGRTFTPASSMKALRREREMLSKQMLKRLSEQDRENLYLKWGIELRTKNRRLQLAHRLWTDTNDMDHITESANIVAKLVSFIKPEQAYKEMFGLNFTPRHTRRRSFSWKRSLTSVL